MKTLNETFTDQEYEALKQAKGKQTWHDFIMELTTELVFEPCKDGGVFIDEQPRIAKEVKTE